MSYPENPILKENRNNYLLYIHPAEKERAKGIAGRTWDPSLRCWLYPRTRRVFESLIAEFGDELILEDISEPPHSLKRVQQPSPEEIIKDKDQEIERLKNQLKIVSQSSGNVQDETQNLQKRLAEREEAYFNLRREFNTIEKQHQHDQEELKKARVEIDTLRMNLNKKRSNQDMTQLLKELALEATSNDKKFNRLLQRMELSETLPIKIQNQLEIELRKMLNIEINDRSMSMFSLIQQAQEAGELPGAAIDLAHTIRRQRNIFAHESENIHEKTHLPRIILSLFAAALLWPELPE